MMHGQKNIKSLTAKLELLGEISPLWCIEL